MMIDGELIDTFNVIVVGMDNCVWMMALERFLQSAELFAAPFFWNEFITRNNRDDLIAKLRRNTPQKLGRIVTITDNHNFDGAKAVAQNRMIDTENY